LVKVKTEFETEYQLPIYIKTCIGDCPECMSFKKCVEDSAQIEDTEINDWWNEQ
jgi:hypothetical protein